MISLHRTTRIQFRCTPKEADRIRNLALDLDLSTADFIRDAIILSIANDPNRTQWRQRLTRAITKMAEGGKP